MNTETHTTETEPCNHVWQFHRGDFEDYFECRKCNKQVPYDPMDLADMGEHGVEE